MKERNSRSNAYQYKYLELLSTHDELTIHEAPEQPINDELVKQMNENIKDALFEMIDQMNMTDIQRNVINLMRQGMNQADIGKTMHSNQGVVWRVIHGNPCYNRTDVPRDGGFIKKIRGAIKRSSKIQSLLRQLEQIV